MARLHREIEARRKLATSARAFLAGEIDAIEVSRRVTRVLGWLSEGTDPFFDVFVAVESESDEFPPDAARSLWNAEYLEELDRERAGYSSMMHVVIERECRRLLDLYGPAVEGGVLRTVVYELNDPESDAPDRARSCWSHHVDRELRLEFEDGSRVFVCGKSGADGAPVVSVRAERHFEGPAPRQHDVTFSSFWSPFAAEPVWLGPAHPEKRCWALSSGDEWRFLSHRDRTLGFDSQELCVTFGPTAYAGA